MTLRIVNARYEKNYLLHLQFADGSEGLVDLEQELDGEIFEPLKDINFFKRFIVHPELHTVTWPNGADFAPEYLYDKLPIQI